MKFAIRGVVAAATLLLVAACGSGQTTAAPREARSTAPSVQSYSTVEQLRDAAVEAGYECAAWRHDDAVELAAQSGGCSDDDVFTTYASEGDLQAQLDRDRDSNAMLSDAGIAPNAHLVGPNWIINSPNGLEKLSERIGGTVVAP